MVAVGATNVLMSALVYAKRGWHVLPIWTPDDELICTCPKGRKCSDNGKHPRSPKGVAAASTDRETIERWFDGKAKGSNLAIATGSISGICVVDVDDWKDLESLEHDFGRLPATLTAATGRGDHYYFLLPEGLMLPTRKRIRGLAVDFLSDGSYVMAPPSRHPTGRSYSWTCRRLPAPLPATFVDFLSRSIGKPRDKGSPPLDPPDASDPSGAPVPSETSDSSDTSDPSRTFKTSTTSEAESFTSETPWLDSLDANARAEILAAVGALALTKPSTRDTNDFILARKILAIPAVRSTRGTPLEEQAMYEVFYMWWKPSEQFSNSVFEAALSNFLRKVAKVHTPSGEPFLDAWERSQQNAPPARPDGRPWRSDHAKRLASFLAEVAKSQKEFYLSGDQVARLLGIQGTAADRQGRDLLNAMLDAKLICLVKAGGIKDGRKLSNRWQYLL